MIVLIVIGLSLPAIITVIVIALKSKKDVKTDTAIQRGCPCDYPCNEYCYENFNSKNK